MSALAPPAPPALPGSSASPSLAASRAGAPMTTRAGRPAHGVSWSPTRRFLIALALIALPMMLGSDVDDALSLLLLLGGLLLALAGLEAALLWRLAGELEVSRRHEQRLSLGEANPVQLRLRYRGALPLAGRIADDPPPGFEPHDVQLPVSLSPGARETVRYAIQPHRRGDHRFGSCWLKLTTWLGLAQIRLRVALEGEVPVYPNLRALQRYRLLARHRMAPAGLHRIRGAGKGSEFDRLREYTRDDTYRDIDWKATARRDSPIVRVLRPERGQLVVLAIDGGRAMAPRIGRDPDQPRDELSAGLQSRHDLALSSALLMADVALTQQDRVGLCLFSHEVEGYFPPRRDASTLPRFLGLLYGAEASYTGTDYRAWARWMLTRLPRRSLLILWTDLGDETVADDLLAASQMLKSRHLLLVVALRDRQLEQLATAPAGDERQLYGRAVAADLLSRRARLVRRLRLAGVRIVEASAEAMSLAVVEQYLEIKLKGLL